MRCWSIFCFKNVIEFKSLSINEAQQEEKNNSSECLVFHLSENVTHWAPDEDQPEREIRRKEEVDKNRWEEEEEEAEEETCR